MRGLAFFTLALISSLQARKHDIPILRVGPQGLYIPYDAIDAPKGARPPITPALAPTRVERIRVRCIPFRVSGFGAAQPCPADRNAR